MIERTWGHYGLAGWARSGLGFAPAPPAGAESKGLLLDCCRICIFVVDLVQEDGVYSHARRACQATPGDWNVPWSSVLAFDDPFHYQSAIRAGDWEIFSHSEATVPRRIDSSGNQRIVDAAL
jgi:hypothetical protein